MRGKAKQSDKVLRAKVNGDGESLNEAAVGALQVGLEAKRRDLSDLAGSLTTEDAQAIEVSVARQDSADLRR